MADQPVKLGEGFRWSPSFLFALLVVTALLAAAILPGAPEALRRALDPINGLIKGAGESCSPGNCRTTLTPRIFTIGDTRAAIDGRLVAAGYKRFAGDGYWQMGYIHPKSFSSPACEVTYTINLAFDRGGRLLRAVGSSESFCY